MTNEMDAKLCDIFDELAIILRCNDVCEQRCVFPDVGTGVGCPINEFRDRVDNAIERSIA